MSGVLPKVHLVRHGETAWTLSGQHTGRTDIPLTERGEHDARELGARLRGLIFTKVLTSPLQRARRTGELAGFGESAEIDPDLMEWDYGDYEGRRTSDIRAERPGWRLFEDGCPGGETLAELSTRADRVIARIRALEGDVLVFAHGHLLRILMARWIALPALEARRLYLETASLPTGLTSRCLCNGSHSAPRDIVVPRSKRPSTNRMCSPSVRLFVITASGRA